MFNVYLEPDFVERTGLPETIQAKDVNVDPPVVELRKEGRVEPFLVLKVETVTYISSEQWIHV